MFTAAAAFATLVSDTVYYSHAPIQTSDGKKIIDYSNKKATDLDENYLIETSEIKDLRPLSLVHECIYPYTGGVSVIPDYANVMGNITAVDWNCSESYDNTKLRMDINRNAHKDILKSYNDWEIVTLKSKGVGGYAIQFPPPPLKSSNEAIPTDILQRKTSYDINVTGQKELSIRPEILYQARSLYGTKSANPMN